MSFITEELARDRIRQTQRDLQVARAVHLLRVARRQRRAAERT